MERTKIQTNGMSVLGRPVTVKCDRSEEKRLRALVHPLALSKADAIDGSPCEADEP